MDSPLFDLMFPLLDARAEIRKNGWSVIRSAMEKNEDKKNFSWEFLTFNMF